MTGSRALKHWRTGLIVSILSGVFLLTVSFQACTGKDGGGQQQNKSGGGSGNGGGYGGKPGPGKYYWTERGHECTHRDSGETTPVRGIMEIKADKSIQYSEGCNEDNPQAVSEDDLRMSNSNNQVFSSLTETASFEKSEDIPLVTSPIKYLQEVCYFFPGGGFPGEYIDLQVVVREEESSQQHPTQVFYTRFLPNMDLFNGLISQFLSLFDGSNLAYDQYSSTTPYFQLRLNKAIPLIPIRSGQLELDLDGTRQNFNTDICILNGVLP